MRGADMEALKGTRKRMKSLMTAVRLLILVGGMVTFGLAFTGYTAIAAFAMLVLAGIDMVLAIRIRDAMWSYGQRWYEIGLQESGLVRRWGSEQVSTEE